MDLTSVLYYQPQQFQFRFARAFAESLPAKCLPGHRGWIFVPRSWLADETYRVLDLMTGQALEPQALAWVNHPLWQRHDFGIARYALLERQSSERKQDLLTTFRQALIGEQLSVLRRAEEWCQEFLSSRTVGSQKLSMYPPVSHMLARVVRDLYALDTGDLSACLAAPGGGAWLTEEIDAICEQLIKLAGGRAMLSGQMVYLRTLFLTLNRTYLEN